MSRILLAWELGGGTGHLMSLRAIAEVLLVRGHEVTLAAREIGDAAKIFNGLPMRVMQAPVCLKNYSGLADPPLNFAEILMRFGYLDAPMIRALVQGWRGLLELTAADRLVADHAPSALLAARGMAVACSTFGNAFSVPPPVAPTPAMRDWLAVPAQRLQNSDALVTDAINAALAPGVPRLASLHQLFEPTDQMFVGIPELDPYGPRTTGHYLGLFSAPSGRATIDWPAGDAPRVFAYLRMDYRHLDLCLRTLSAGSVRCLVNIFGASREIIARYQGPHLAFTEGHVDIQTMTEQCDLVVCHSGLGTVNAVLRTGKPLLLLPGQLEQFLLARNVEKLGVGVVVHPETAAPDIAGALARMTTDPGFVERARVLARRYAAAAPVTVVEQAVARIENHNPAPAA